MKKTLFAIFALALLCNGVMAQQTGFKGWTLKAGANYSTLKTTADFDIPNSYQMGFTGGISLDWSFTDILGVSTELLYSHQGGKMDMSKKLRGVEATENVIFLNLPILANVYLTEDLTFKTGVQFGYYISASDKITGATGDARPYDLLSSYKVMDFSIPVGLAYQFKFGLILDARYNFGLSNIVKEAVNYPEFKAKNSYASFTIGYRF